jgi:hypothetical protein
LGNKRRIGEKNLLKNSKRMNETIKESRKIMRCVGQKKL